MRKIETTALAAVLSLTGLGTPLLLSPAAAQAQQGSYCYDQSNGWGYEEAGCNWSEEWYCWNHGHMAIGVAFPMQAFVEVVMYCYNESDPDNAELIGWCGAYWACWAYGWNDREEPGACSAGALYFYTYVQVICTWDWGSETSAHAQIITDIVTEPAAPFAVGQSRCLAGQCIVVTPHSAPLVMANGVAYGAMCGEESCIQVEPTCALREGVHRCWVGSLAPPKSLMDDVVEEVN